VVVTDIRMPPTGTDEGIRAAAHLREHRPDIGVVVLSQYANPEYALALLSDGSARRAYLLKESIAGVDELVRAIRAVHQLVAGGDVVLQQIAVPRRALRHQGDGVFGVVVLGQDHHTDTRTPLAHLAGRLDPLPLEGGRHAGVSDQHLGLAGEYPCTRLT
jgi:DNA-binding NarL/FixJ family response regulator